MRLDELVYIAARQRQFNVGVNGSLALAAFNIFGAAGSGTISVTFANGPVDLPFVNAIEVLSGTTVVQAIDCGVVPGGTITVNPTIVTNQGTVAASNGGTPAVNSTWTNTAGANVTAYAGTVNLGGTWSNAGSITATNSTVNLGGSFTLAQASSFTASCSSVNLTGTLNAFGSSLILDATTGSWNLAGRTLLGDTYTATDGARLVLTASGGTLDGVTLAGDLDGATSNGATASILDGLILNGSTVYLGDTAGSTDGQLVFPSNETLGGTGTVVTGRSGLSQAWCTTY